MYKILGADGKEYGPVSIEQFREWVAQGRANAQTQILESGKTEWKPAAQIPELAILFASSSPPPLPSGPPPVLRPLKPAAKQQGLAVLSFVLGICSFVLCLSAITGIPAIICGHVAQSRAKRFPQQYGGAGFAVAGIILGYVSILFSLVVLGLLLPALAKIKQNGPRWQGRPPWQGQIQRVDCQNNLRQIGLSFKVWALEHNDQFPFNVSTNQGGTLELCKPGPDGFDANAVAHFRIISKELSTPTFLVCTKDHVKHAAPDFDSLQPDNITYLLRTGTNINSDNPQEVLAVCPIDGNQLFCDGNVRSGPRPTPK